MKKNYFTAVLAGSILFISSFQSCMHESLETEIINVQQDPVYFIRSEYMKGKGMVTGKLIEWEKARKYKREGNIILITVPVKNKESNQIEEITFRIDHNKVSGHLWKFESNTAFAPEDYHLTAHEIMEKITGKVSYIALEGSMRYEKKIVRGKFIDEVAKSGSGAMNSPSCKPCHGQIDEIVIPAPGGGGPTNPFPPDTPVIPIPTIVIPAPNPNNPPDTDPCTKGKKIQNSSDIKKGVDELKKTASGGTGEKGFKAKSDGSTSGIISGGDHKVNLGDKSGYQGGFHNHTSTGIAMHSPPDIDMLLGFARAQGNHGNINGAYFGMISPNGTQYITWFNGSYQDALTNFSQEQLNNLLNDYKKLELSLSENPQYSDNNGATLNSKGLEKLFSDTLKKMGLNGKIGLQRVDPDNSIKNINFNQNGGSTPVPCP
ncbi:hypothetical protein [Chryseobacterium vrystaatense]|uniref:Uncharacterized protein n=1 Tax=Chryseobacterium vrystaatense TaxID=307480 RepID=A0A1M5IAL3_9FLAO|nr:hypothetical protein [Chryseobacterium vrystaatense]SHG25265.1 hypothetical protein SAMN02787073_3802 [Chryseobacterium vrystaatense]